MVHQAEVNNGLKITKKSLLQVIDSETLVNFDVVFVRLPNITYEESISPMTKQSFSRNKIKLVCTAIRELGTKLRKSSKLLIMGEPYLLPYIHHFVSKEFKFHNWFGIRLDNNSINGKFLKNDHIGVLLYTKGSKELSHGVIRIGYEYCSFCKKTTKDYGGKKHLYHSFGTSMSDVWKDITISRNDEFPKIVIERFQDLFSVEPNKKMLVTSLWDLKQSDYKRIIKDERIPHGLFANNVPKKTKTKTIQKNKLLLGDCIKNLEKIDDESVDMVFVDPPYNLSKEYLGYSDNLSYDGYFEWCNEWLSHLTRILKKGGTFFVVNIPSSSLEYFIFLNQKLTFQNWIIWDALSAPVKKILPAHYSILFFTKGKKPKVFNYKDGSTTNDPICEPLNYGYCIRNSCINKRNKEIGTTKLLTDLWTDVHRIKHNSLREDHPTLLPPKLVRRFITLFTNKEQLVLDCFNGVGTTSLVAQELGRHYCGIEKNSTYHKISKTRHLQMQHGKSPFEKRKTIPKAKNSSLKRVKVRKYEVPKRTLQLEVKEISKKIGRVPTREDVKKHSKYPIDYFDNYFRSWYEVTNAVKNEGMSEIKSSV